MRGPGILVKINEAQGKAGAETLTATWLFLEVVGDITTLPLRQVLLHTTARPLADEDDVIVCHEVVEVEFFKDNGVILGS